jgi:hypothetical protein
MTASAWLLDVCRARTLGGRHRDDRAIRGRAGHVRWCRLPSGSKSGGSDQVTAPLIDDPAPAPAIGALPTVSWLCQTVFGKVPNCSRFGRVAAPSKTF